ncbi:MAG: beta-lactamase family protein [Balneolales bacterium]|nr:beta-lactamase family protein [Balneolales bacterium]
MRNFAIILLLSNIPFSTSCAQNTPDTMSDIVEHNGITSPLHQENVGSIKFTSGIFPQKEYGEGDFLSSFEIEDSSNLNFIAFFDNSLTNYLHQLAPDLSIGELHKNGNYQFSFYLDAELMYTENLNQGAGLPSQKNEETILHRPLLSSIGVDSWGRFLWMRFFYRSGANFELWDGAHQLKIEIRPYLELDEILIGDVIAEGKINIQLDEPVVSEEQIAIQPVQANSGWEVSGERFNEEKILEMNKLIAQNRIQDLTSIVVIKGGKLLIEQYFNSADRTTLHNTRSVGKSFASTVTGIALEDGYLTGTNQTIDEFYDLKRFQNYSERKGTVTLKSLLTMSSGFLGNDSDYDSPGNEENMYPTSDWVKFALDLPMDENKQVEETWEYFTAGTVLLGDILHQAVPGGLEKYADEKLFRPLGITNYQWQYTPQKVANTAGGLQLTSLDYAKFGQLYLNGGTWNGQQVLSEEWVNRSFTNYFKDTPDQTAYGFLFWNQMFSVNGDSYEAYLSNGNGGNKIVMFKDEPIVIIITATAYGMPFAHPQAELMIQNYILPAILE